MYEFGKPRAIALEPESLERLQTLWKACEAGTLGFNPSIEQGYELGYYAGNALLALRLRIGFLRYYLAPTIKPDHLARQVVTELEWAEKDVEFLYEVLRSAMNLTPAK